MNSKKHISRTVLAVALLLCGSLAAQTTLSPRIWEPFGRPTSAASLLSLSIGTANTGTRASFNIWTPVTFSYSYVKVETVDTGKFSSFAIYNDALTTKFCETTPFSMGTAGFVRVTWSSPCTLSPYTGSGSNSFWLVGTSDGTVGQIAAYFITNPLLEANYSGWLVKTTAAVSTGTGSSIAFNPNLSGLTWSNDATLSTLPYIVCSTVSF